MTQNSYNDTESNKECIWSASGIFQYSLCHLQFDCENCEIDKAFRSKNNFRINQETQIGSRKSSLDLINNGRLLPVCFEDLYKQLAEMIDSFSDVPYIKEAYYFPSHIWMFPKSANRAIVGIDGFLSKCLEPVKKVIFPITSKNISKNGTFCWLFFKDWNIGLTLPFSAEVKGINSTVLQYPDEVVSSPLSNGWLMEIEGDFDLPERTNFAGLSKLYSRKMNTLIEELAEKFPPKSDIVGSTLQDGGARIESLSMLLGRDNYIRLIKKIINDI